MSTKWPLVREITVERAVEMRAELDGFIAGKTAIVRPSYEFPHPDSIPGLLAAAEARMAEERL